MAIEYRLLTKEEIKELDQTDLEGYLFWLERYKKEKLQALLERKTLFYKMQEKVDSLRAIDCLRKDKERISKIKKVINKINK